MGRGSGRGVACSWAGGRSGLRTQACQAVEPGSPQPHHFAHFEDPTRHANFGGIIVFEIARPPYCRQPFAVKTGVGKANRFGTVDDS